MKIPQPKKAAIPFVLIGIAVALYAANWQAVEWGYRPFMYCALRPVGGMMVGWLQIVGLVTLVWFAVEAVRKSVSGLLYSSLAVVLAYGAPQFADTALRLGGSCG